jgi:epoxyqueuosine reductase
MAEELQKILIDSLIDAGASMVGYADIRELPSDVRRNLPTGITIACALKPEIVVQISDGPTKEYEAEYNRLNEFLNNLGDLGVSILEKHGYRAVSLISTQSKINRDTLATPLPQKTTARLAGLGWIGKCALLVTEEFGSAIRMNTVLTDAPLPVGIPIDESRCGKCAACVEVCPAGAPSGHDWSPGMDRADFFDAFACYEEVKSTSRSRNIKVTICGRCIAACPWTAKYIKR